MCHIEGKESFESLPEKGADQSGKGGGSGVDFDLRDEFVEREQNQESQGERDEVLDQKVIDKGDDFGVDVCGHDLAFSNRAVNGRPYGRYRERDEHDDSDDEHNKIFHKAVVEEGFLEAGFEDEVDGIDEIREEEAGCDKRAGEPEPTEVGDVPRELLDPGEEIGVELGEKFFREDVEAAERNF